MRDPGDESEQATGKVGRPSLYDPSYAAIAGKLCGNLGATIEDLAKFFDVSIESVKRWAIAHDEFRSALKTGREAADERVEQSLYRRAIGYSFEAVKIMQDKGMAIVVPYTEHVPADVTACIFWLKNRRPDEWREKRDDKDQWDFTPEARRLMMKALQALTAAKQPGRKLIAGKAKSAR